MSIEPAGTARHYVTSENRVTFVPLSIKRRYRRTLLIAPPQGLEAETLRAGPQGAPSFDLPLIRTLGKAFYWQKLLDSGDVPACPCCAVDTWLTHLRPLKGTWMPGMLTNKIDSELSNTIGPSIVRNLTVGAKKRP